MKERQRPEDATTQAATTATAGALKDSGGSQGPHVDPISLAALYLKVRFNDQHLGTATGFVAAFEGRYYLISSNHVFSGRHAETGKCLLANAAIPNNIRVAHPIAAMPNNIVWRFHGERLWDEDDSPRWFMHPGGPGVDVAALELQNVKGDTLLNPIEDNIWRTELPLYPAMPVSIVGFPFGIRPNGVFLPVWKSGHIAGEAAIDVQPDRPAFLIDATTRNGMSGSPVIARSYGGYLSRQGNWIATERPMTRFLGVYSSHRNNMEIGDVWRPDAIIEVLTSRTRYVPP